MKTEQFTPQHESWRLIDDWRKNGAMSHPALGDTAADKPEAAQRAAWNYVIDHKLSEWARSPSQLEDDGLSAPTPEIIQRALDFARALEQSGYPAPTNVVPDANGGIVFHRRQAEFSEEVHFWDDSSIEYFCFHGGNIVERKPL